MKKHGFTGSRLLISLLALVLIVSVLFSACTKTTSTTTTQSSTTTQTSTSTTQTSTTTSSAQKVLKIGSVIDMTGGRGLQTANWYKLMAKLYNDAGGWKIGNDTYKVQMFIYDTQGNVQTAKDLLTRAVLNDGCKFILGWSATGSPDVDCTITEPNKVIFIGEDLTAQGANPKYKYYFSTGNFFNSASPYIIAKDQVKKGVKSYVSVKPDNQVGHFFDPIMNAAWKLASPTIDYKGTVYVPASTVDWGPIATKIKSYNADCADIIYLGFIPNSIPNTYRALYDVGYKGVILPGLMSQPVLDTLVTTVGKAAVEGGEVPGPDVKDSTVNPKMIALINAYIAEYGSWGPDGSPVDFHVLEAAINATQSIDTDVIANYFSSSPPPIETLGQQYIELFARPELNNYRTISGGTDGPLGIIHDGKLVPGPIITMKDQYLFTVISGGLGDTYKAYWEQYGYPAFPAAEKGLNSLNFTDLGITGHD